VRKDVDLRKVDIDFLHRPLVVANEPVLAVDGRQCFDVRGPGTENIMSRGFEARHELAFSKSSNINIVSPCFSFHLYRDLNVMLGKKGFSSANSAGAFMASISNSEIHFAVYSRCSQLK
jgi:hypothetical protein